MATREARRGRRRGAGCGGARKEEEKEEVEVELRTVAGDGSSSFVRSSSFSVAAGPASIEDATCDRSRIASLARCGTGAAPAAAASARSSLTRRLALCCPRCSLLDLYIGRSSGRAGASNMKSAQDDSLSVDELEEGGFPVARSISIFFFLSVTFLRCFSKTSKAFVYRVDSNILSNFFFKVAGSSKGHELSS